MSDLNLPPVAPSPSTKEASTTTSAPSQEGKSAQPVAASGDADGKSAKPKTEFERKLGMADIWVKWTAILLGGLFAIMRFGLFDWPNLEKTFGMDGNLAWLQDQGGPGACVADL